MRLRVVLAAGLRPVEGVDDGASHGAGRAGCRGSALAKMKLVATLVLVAAAIVFVLTFFVGQGGSVALFVRAAAEAGMVGGLTWAEWAEDEVRHPRVPFCSGLLWRPGKWDPW